MPTPLWDRYFRLYTTCGDVNFARKCDPSSAGNHEIVMINAKGQFERFDNS